MPTTTNHQPPTTYPLTRPRRLRQAPWIRELVRETRLSPADFIWPLFVQEGADSTPVPSLPGVSRLSIAAAVDAAKQAKALGIPAIALFPVTPGELKTPEGSEALNPDNLVCRAIREIKSAVPEVGIIADVALDPYTTHGHDGLVDEKGDVHNDATLDMLARQALTLAQAGADVLAPSDMMDGRVGIIRMALEADGFSNLLILAYAAKYASAYYAPFRDAVGSSPSTKHQAPSTYLDKSTYQMDPANADEAMKEIAMDIAEGADMVMVKPGLPYLDIIHRAASSFSVPVLAYHVSGEYAMAKAMPNADAIIYEQMLCLKRAGARAILTYAAAEVAKQLMDDR